MDAKKEIIEYINDNLGEHLTLEGLCEHFHTNRTTLARRVKEATGKSPIRYILEERLRRSRTELEEGELSVSEVAEKYGFSDDNYFIRAFKKQYGISPLKFRKQNIDRADGNSMTLSEFEHYIRQGFGRAVLMLKEQPHKEHFRASVINNAVYDPRYDQQCNENRGHYIKELIDCFEDSEELYEEILNLYSREVHPEDYHIGNLRQWAETGCLKAKEALVCVYENCYNAMLNTATLHQRPNPAFNAYTYAAQTLHGVDESYLTRLLHDGINLMKFCHTYGISDFTHFFDEIIAISHKKMMSALVELAENDKVVKFFYDGYVSEHEKSVERYYELNRGKLHVDMAGVKSWQDVVDLCIREGKPMLTNDRITHIWCNLSDTDKREVTQAVEKEGDVMRRTVLLMQLKRNAVDLLCDYPRDPSPLIAEIDGYKRSDDYTMGKENRMMHQLILLVRDIRHPVVRTWAIENLPRISDWGYRHIISAFINNYIPEDRDRMFLFVTSQTDRDIIHDIGLAVTDALQYERIEDFPEELLFWLYEHTPCTNCRGMIANLLIERYSLTVAAEIPDEYVSIVRELCHDSDEPNRIMGERASIGLDMRLAHSKSVNHRTELEKDNICGCFYCKSIYSPAEITAWIDGGSTALCPRCGIDSVIGSSSGYPVTEDFLTMMNNYWFNCTLTFEYFLDQIIRRIIAENSGLEPLLKKQYEAAEIRKVDHHKRGFMVNYNIFEYSSNLAEGYKNCHLGRVHAEIDGIEYGMGFVLFIRDGKISALEGYTYEEDLPPKWWEKEYKIKPYNDVCYTKEYIASLHGYEKLFDAATAALEAYPDKEYYTQCTALLSESGKVYTVVSKNILKEGADPLFFESIRKTGDTRIIRMLSMWSGGSIDMGPYTIRMAVLMLDKRNRDTEVLGCGAVSFVRTPLELTLPPKKLTIKERTECLKNLIAAAEADMASHPAFPQEYIKYEAVAIRTAKGNIYHAVLDLDRNDEDELIAQMKKNDDTHITMFVSMFCEGRCEIGSHKLRKKLRELDGANGETEFYITYDGMHRRYNLGDTLPLYAEEKLDNFEFHDTILSLVRYDKTLKCLILSARSLNIHKNTEQNPYDSDMEIKEAKIYLHGFRILSLECPPAYQWNEDNELVALDTPEVSLSGEEALQYLLEQFATRFRVTVLELENIGNGEYYMTIDIEQPGTLAMKFTVSRATVTWSEYNGEAWYEQYFRDMRARGIIPKKIEE
ncbi:MAG: helix-turn-helix transcriptional regulator [Clostridia bacterium]|nr:helix-turn-helix transcriptional regulator [Clostridia bacterium]